MNESSNLALLKELCETMVSGSLCALGGMAPFPVLSVLKHFPEGLKSQPPSPGKATERRATEQAL